MVSHKYAYESAGPFGRRLRCSSSRGARHTGGFDRRSPLQVIAPCRRPKCPRIFATVFVRHHTSVLSHGLATIHLLRQAPSTPELKFVYAFARFAVVALVIAMTSLASAAESTAQVAAGGSLGNARESVRTLSSSVSPVPSTGLPRPWAKACAWESWRRSMR